MAGAYQQANQRASGAYLQPHTLAGGEPAFLVQFTTVGVDDVVVPLAQVCRDAVLVVAEAPLGMSGICVLVTQHTTPDRSYDRETVLVCFFRAVRQPRWSRALCPVHMVLFVENYFVGVLPGEAGKAAGCDDCMRNTGSGRHCDERGSMCAEVCAEERAGV